MRACMTALMHERKSLPHAQAILCLETVLLFCEELHSYVDLQYTKLYQKQGEAELAINGIEAEDPVFTAVDQPYWNLVDWATEEAGACPLHPSTIFALTHIPCDGRCITHHCITRQYITFHTSLHQ